MSKHPANPDDENGEKSPPAPVSGYKKKLPNWRSAHRSRSHDSAHQEDESAFHHAQVIDHPLVARTPGELVVDQATFDALIDELRAGKRFAYDTEFIGELSYHPLLCLIQVATEKRIALIDPMIDLDLRRFWEILADESVEKIVHAGQQDLEPVARNLGAPHRARNVLDTQIVAGFVGMAYPVALSKLVLEMLGVKIAKGMTFTHWDQRPLSPIQLRYAADDVRYLPALWDQLRKRLDATGHAEWAIAECEEACDPAQFGFNPETSYQRVRGGGALTSAATAVLRELTIWRDAVARQRDVPARTLVKDEVLVDLSRSPVKQIEKLDRVRGLPRPIEEEYGQTLVELTLRALASPRAHEHMPRPPEPTPTDRFAADALFAAAGVMCAANSIDISLITSRNEIGEFLRHASAGESGARALNELHLLRTWRREALGEPLLNFVRDEGAHTTLNFRWHDRKLTSS